MTWTDPTTTNPSTTAETAHPQPHLTHTVFNQSGPRVDVNEYELNIVLQEAVARHDAGWAEAELREVGALVGSAEFQRDAHLANTITPELHTFDRWGHRIDEVEYHPSYHRIISASISHGAHTVAGPTRSRAHMSPGPRCSCSSVRSSRAMPARCR